MERRWRRTLRAILHGLTIITSALFAGSAIQAQGLTTASIRGSIKTPDGRPVPEALVQVVNVAMGYTSETRSRGGKFLIQGLVPGGPYRIVIKAIGFAPQVLTGLSIALGDEREIAFTLVALPGELDTVRISASNRGGVLPTGGGTGISISDSALRRLPTLNRDMYDFVRLVPQAGTRFGLSGGGASFRYNSYVIDGVSDRQLQGNNVLGATNLGGKTISLEAVKEYQVLLSPYEARYGDFAGMLVTAVTKSGTNDFHGSTYMYSRNAGLARPNSFVGTSSYHREQFGFSLGGPIIRNRLHFFVAPEFQRAEAPTPGPYIEDNGEVGHGLPVSIADVTHFQSLLRDKKLDPGDGGRANAPNPATTLFGRIDLDVRELNSRVVFLENYSTVDAPRFTRPDGLPTFSLSSGAVTLRTAKRSSAVQIFTHPSRTVFNELLLSYMDRPITPTNFTPAPSVQVTVRSTTAGKDATLLSGPPPPASGIGAVQKLSEVADNIVFQPALQHTIETGVHVEFFRYNAVGVRGLFGQWRFLNFAALEKGDATNYVVTKNFGGAEARVSGAQPSAYVSDDWRVSDRLSLTVGLRADELILSGVPDYNPAVDSIFNRRTSEYPETRVQWSPRFGFSWRPFGNNSSHVRGGAGIFVGPPPLGWLVGPMRSNGAGVRTLRCVNVAGTVKVPKFVADPMKQPDTCADGSGFTDGPVDLVDRNLKMAESFRTSIAFDQQLPFATTATIEALYSRVRSDFLFVNSNLKGPQSIDAHGRVLYGTFDQTTGRAVTSLVSDRFAQTEVIDLRNHSLGHSWSVTTQLSKPFSEGLAVQASYTYSRARDVQSLTNMSAVAPLDTWASGRPLSGLHEKLFTGVSSFDIPHRVILAATYAAPWRRWKTDFSLYYVGESGSPFTFGDSSANGLGDLNADGTSANDPIYVPRNASDPTEIAFDLDGQGDAFEKFIRATPCLQKQRGSIMARNSCRGPWVHTSNASIRQSLQTVQSHDLSLQLELFNLLNLLNAHWGLMKIPNPWILTQARQSRSTPTQPVFSFDAASAAASTQNLESGYQLQLSLRYSF